MPAAPIDLRTPLSLRTSFAFPIQSPIARREVLIGAAWLFVPGIGWLMNMGHRIVVVHNMMHSRAAWPAWHSPLTLLWHGTITFAGMLYYYAPALGSLLAAWWLESILLGVLGAALFLIATVAIPGFMSHYCRQFDPREIFNPFRALRRCIQGGLAYWRAWAIALAALAVSFVGLLFFGLGFLVSSVWFWQVAGFSFASVFTSRFELVQPIRA